MSYVRKLGASALVIAAAFAVAFAVLVSTSEAQVAPGKSENVAHDSGSGGTIPDSDNVTFEILDSSTASASFAANDGTEVTCAEGETCDVDKTTDGPQVKVNIDADAGTGKVFVRITGFESGEVRRHVISVVAPAVATEIKVSTPSKGSIPASGVDVNDAAVTSTFTVALLDSDGDAIGGRDITIVASLGDLTTAFPVATDLDGSKDDACTAKGTCTGLTPADDPATTADDQNEGQLSVSLQGDGTAGISTVTITSEGLTETVDVILHGGPKSITAEPEQGSVQVGGDVFVVVTITDSAGNGVGDYAPAIVANADNAPVGPTAKSTPVSTAGGVNKDVTGTDNDIPSCDVVPADANATPPVVGSDGTNGNGQCVIQVSAPKKGEDSATASATRGTHTLTVQLAAITPAANSKAVFTIEVAGAPSSMTSDASEYVDPLSETKITVSAVDDEGVLVGEQEFAVIQIEGSGNASANGATTKDGSQSFTYIAPLTEGTAVFLVRVGTGTSRIQDTITVNVGTEPADEPEPDPEPEVTSPWLLDDPSTSSLVVFNGGSVDELAAALAASCDNASVAVYASVDGGYVSYVPNTVIGAANAAFLANFADGLPQIALQVTDCN